MPRPDSSLEGSDMVKDHQHKFDGGKKIVTFVQERLASFAPGSRVLELVGLAKGLVAIIEGLFAEHGGALARAAAATVARGKAREQMRGHAQMLLRTVRTFAQDPPTTAAALDVYVDSDKKLLAAVQALHDHAAAFAGNLTD